MPLLQVRDLPVDLYDTLTRVAQAENRSIAQETIVLLRSALNLREERAARRKTVMEEIEKLSIKIPAWARDPADLIREDRDR